MEWAEALEKCRQVHQDRQVIDRCISSIFACRILWTEEPGGYSPWGCKESDMTEQLSTHLQIWVFPGGSVIKNLPATAGDARDLLHSQGEEDPLEEGMATHSSTLAWRIPKDGEVWWATVHDVAKSWTRLSNRVRTEKQMADGTSTINRSRIAKQRLNDYLMKFLWKCESRKDKL